MCGLAGTPENPDNVSSVHYANTAEKEIIFKVIIASAILHGPAVGSDYDSNLDFYESNADFQRLTGDKKTHFEIIRDLNRFAKAAVKSFITGQEIIDGKLNNLTEVLKKSGASVDDFFRWFKEEYYDHSFDRENIDTFFSIMEGDYKKAVSLNSQSGLVNYRAQNYVDKFIGEDHGRVFDFGAPIDAGGGGDCGYFSLGIQRMEFVEFLKSYDFSRVQGLPTLHEMSIRANAAAMYDLVLTDDDDDASNRAELINLYSKESTWMTLEDFTLVSITPIVSTRNNWPLNEQIIYVWSFVEGHTDLILVGAFYKGDDLRANYAKFAELIKNSTPEQHIYFNGIDHFQQLNPK